MILHSIEIEQFGGLKQYKLDLQPGFCYLYGVNETGKSTLCAFLSAMFYGMPGKQRGAGLKGDSRKLYMPWNERYMSGSVTFSAEGQTYVLKRRFGTTSRSDRCNLFSADDWHEISIAPEEIGQRFLGMGSDAFQKTLFIGQSGAAFVGGREDELMTRLSNLKNTGEEDASVQKALDALETAAHELVTKTGRGGAVTQLDAKIEQLETEALEAARRGEALQGLVADRNGLRHEVATLETAIAEKEAQKEKAVAFAAYLERQKQRDHRKASEQRLAELKAEQQAAEETLNALRQQAESAETEQLTQEKVVYLAEKETIRQQMLLKQKEAEKLHLELVALQQQQTQTKAEMPLKSRLSQFLLFVGMFLLFGVVICGFFLSVACFLLLLPVFFAACFACGVMRHKTKEVKAETERLQRQIDEKERALAAVTEKDAESKLKELDDEIDGAYLAAGVENLAELSAKVEASQRLFYQAEAARKEAEQCSEAVRQLEQQLAEEQTPPPEAEQTYSGEPADRLEAALADMHRQLIEAERRLAQQNAKFEHDNGSGRSYAVIQTELEAAKTERAELNERYEAIMLAHSALSACAEDLKNNFAPLLNERLSAIIEKLTDGRYCAAKISDAYAMKLQMADDSDIIDAEYVSAGTYELFYFALRLAALHTITNEIPLLILDDAFIQLDDKRRQAAFGALLDEPAEQILYFSCHKPADYIHTVLYLQEQSTRSE